MARKQFNVSEPNIQLSDILKQNAKYSLKQKGYSFHDIKNTRPVFAFDYISLYRSELCFNNDKLSVVDYNGFLGCLKDISNKTYQVLKETPNYRFHQVDFNDKRVSLTRKQFKAILAPREDLLSDDELPTLYQLDLNYIREARVCGFLFKGVFYLVWFDRFHKIYSKN